jgi:hypothetical protein
MSLRYQQHHRIPQRLVNEDLIWVTAQWLVAAAEHAVLNSGAYGDAALELRILGSNLRLGFEHHQGFWDSVEGGPTLDGPIVSRRTVLLDVIVTNPQELLAAVRLFLTDVFMLSVQPKLDKSATTVRSGSRTYTGGRDCVNGPRHAGSSCPTRHSRTKPPSPG